MKYSNYLEVHIIHNYNGSNYYFLTVVYFLTPLLECILHEDRFHA